MRVGFIGLGIMGKPMAKNLLKASYELVVTDLNPLRRCAQCARSPRCTA